jgi:hypothetical protein
MIDLILKLIDRCVQLAKQREAQNRSIYSDFIEPLMRDFQSVHDNYISSFSKYREAVISSENPTELIETLLEEINHDSLYSIDGRSRLRSFKLLDEVLDIKSDKDINSLIDAICYYLDSAILERYGMETYRISNARRFGLKLRIQQELSHKNLDIKETKKLILKILDQSVDAIQKDYEQVISKFQKAKIKLLRPK